MLKNTIRFWLKVFARSLLGPVNLLKSQIIVGLALLAALVFVAYVLGGLINEKIIQGYVNDLGGFARLFASLFVCAFILFLIGIVYQPAKMYEEMGGFVESPLGLERRPNELSHEGERICVSIDVHNKSKYPVKDCYLRIARRPAGNLEPLSWSQDNPNPVNSAEYSPITIPAEARIRSDIAVAWMKEPTAVVPSFRNRVLSLGTHKISIFINGTWKGFPIEHIQDFELSFSGNGLLELNDFT